ncbi:TetR/AcrR family transcriptional regulator [Alicyclobacillus kakegawensis]|uniref:TetR/AcrR family transcriptional regulator n=1 Tax=Alicyclobacillus kakegawensis TaxID=392012 RepID=UPI0008356563|nr:TetR family transcriptional regulator [Alicyclobacillus kakegawensis]
MDQKAVDLRVRRTRKLLQEAFLKLMAQKSFQAITVQDITALAMVNRSTFYDHFADKYELMEYAVSEQFRERLKSKLPDKDHYSVENLRALIITMWEYFGCLQGHCQHADERQRILCQSQVVNVVKKVLTNWLSESPGTMAGDPSTRELAVAVTSWAIYGAAHYWAENKPKGTGAELAELVIPILDGMLQTDRLLNRN